MVTDDSARPLESGHGEVTSSIAWLPGQSSCLAAGMGNRFLRLFDTRGNGHTHDILCILYNDHHNRWWVTI